NGRWQNSEVPRNFSQMTFRVIDSDYTPAVFGCEGGPAEDGVVQWAASDYLSGNAVMLLTHGIEVSGIVVDPSGKPVAETTITRNHEWRNPSAALTTGEDGRFKISNLQPGELILTFQARGLAAQTRDIPLSKGMPEMKVEMKPGNIFQGTVVDESGKPISGVQVQLDRLDIGPLEYDWSSSTDEKGRFLWDSAPEGEHPYYFYAGGFRPRFEPALVADGQDKVITLRPVNQEGKTIFDGQVTDAESKAPITQFDVLVKEFKGDDANFSKKEVSATNGVYSVSVDSRAFGCMIEISAAGYAPQMCERKSPPDGDQRVDFALVKGEGIAGRVYTPDGKPATGAEVAVCREEMGALIGRGHFVDRFQTNIIGADGDGRFVLPRLDGAQTLCAVSDAGVVATNFADAKGPLRLTLVPWGTVKGIAMSHGKPLANETMGLAGLGVEVSGCALYREDFAVKTGADGGFVISNVPPGKVALCEVVNHKYFQRQTLEIKPGEVAEAQIGGNGRDITGKFAVDSSAGNVNWTNGPSIQLNSADGGNAQSFAVTMDSMGHFKFEDVPAGAYKLQVDVRQTAEQGGQRVATLLTNVVVSAGEGAVDFGQIDVPPVKVLRLGDLAPAFEIKTVDGQPLRLSDFRGKYVLLDFWATWCGPCVAETPHLKAVYDAFGGGDHFVMISLSLDGEASAPANFARKNNIKWVQGFLGQWSESSVTIAYGVDGIPSIFLIDPEGRIIDRDLRGDGIRSAVERALGNR
ncbi:MAG TPA: carboxypeptidase regulatory-like domain-containing protein, partial [Verrucomicrobiae bacterium]